MTEHHKQLQDKMTNAVEALKHVAKYTETCSVKMAHDESRKSLDILGGGAGHATRWTSCLRSWSCERQAAVLDILDCRCARSMPLDILD